MAIGKDYFENNQKFRSKSEYVEYKWCGLAGGAFFGFLATIFGLVMVAATNDNDKRGWQSFVKFTMLGWLLWFAACSATCLGVAAH